MLEQVGSPENAGAFLDEAIAAKRKIMGFGHREYKVKDPRAVILQALVEEMFASFGHDDLYDVARAIEAEAASRLGPKGIYPNVDFYSGIIYEAMGFPVSIFPVLFAVPRTVGWLAQWQEMLADKEQPIARPRQVYLGEGERDYVAMDKR